MEKERSSGHPSKNYWLVGGLARKVERGYVSLAKSPRSLQEIVKIDAEGHMQVHSLRPRPRFPQPEHGISSVPYPVECDLPFREDLREFKS